MGKYKALLIFLFLLIVIAIPVYLLLSTKAVSKHIAYNQLIPTQQPSPTVTPLTPSSADTTLSATDTQIQITLNQVDADLQSVNAINSSQDTTSGF